VAGRRLAAPATWDSATLTSQSDRHGWPDFGIPKILASASCPALLGLGRKASRCARPTLEESDSAKVKAIKAALRAGTGVRRIARELKAGAGTLLR
jgi:hypothetical protein